MKKIIAIVLMLCLMIPTCLADSETFHELVLETLKEDAIEEGIDLDIQYYSKDYQGSENEDYSLSIYYFDEYDVVMIVMSEKNGYDYTYLVNNLAIVIRSFVTIASLGFELVYSDDEFMLFGNNNYTKNCYNNYYNGQHVIMTNFDNFAEVLVDNMSAAALNRALKEFKAITNYESV